jgi:hypothetical protein
MQDLDRALSDIKALRSQLARGMQFRGYGPAAFAATGLLAIAAAVAQAQWIANPASDLSAYLSLWVATAALSAAIIGIDVITRSQRAHSGLADEMIQSAAEQLLPAMVAGALLTFVITYSAPSSAWMLPGLWQIVLSLGVFASCRSLPPQLIGVGVWYLGSGLVCLAVANGSDAFSPWAMGVPFGIGQLLTSALIYRYGGADADA